MLNASTRKLVIGILGVYCAYILSGYLIQQLFTNIYTLTDPNTKLKVKEQFKFPTLITWSSAFTCAIYGLLKGYFTSEPQNPIPLKEQILLGALYTFNYLPTNLSLLFLPYHVQAIGKNLRYLLTVSIGAFFSRVKRSTHLKLPKSKVLVAIFITICVLVFMYFQTVKKKKAKNDKFEHQWVGYLLILVAIFCDAFFADTQVYCKVSFKPTPNHLFTAANYYAFILIFIISYLMGELVPSMQFCMRHPEVFYKLMLVNACQIAGQLSVYSIISNFRSHIYPLISTTRKIFTILLSIFMFKHSVLPIQWFSLAGVFLAMGFEFYDEINSREKHKVVLEKRKSLQQPISDGSDAGNGILNLHSKNQRTNRFKDDHLGIQKSPEEEESCSKYRYKWRLNEIHDQSKSPPKKD